MTGWKTLDEFEAELLKDGNFRREHDALAPEYQVARTILATRQAIGMSQEALARAVGTTQARVSKWERGEELPRLDALSRVAEATGYELQIGLVPATTSSRTSGRSRARKTTGRLSARRPASSSGAKSARKATGRKKSSARKATSARKTTGRKTSSRKTTARKTTRRKSAVRKSAARKKSSARRSVKGRRK